MIARHEHGAMARRRAQPCPNAALPGLPVLGLERWGALTGLAAIVAVGVASLGLDSPFGGSSAALWWLAYVSYLGVFVADAFLLPSPTPRLTRLLLGVQVVAGCAMVIISPEGWAGVVLVVTAASASFTLSGGGVAMLIVGQTTVLAAAMSTSAWSPTEAVMGAVVYASFQAFAALVTLGQRRESEARAQLAATHAELRAATALLAASTRSAERLRISRDLHDVVGHQLTALALELEVASHAQERADHVVRARAIAKDLLRDVRAAVGELRTSADGLETALRELVSDLPGLQVELRVDERASLTDPEALTILRSVQELATNALRHAEATTLTIAVTVDDEGVHLHAHDDGHGTRTLVPGNGLTGLRERIEQHGGQISFDPGGAGGGFAVDARLPAS